MILPLQLRHDAAANFPPAAWFLPGASVEHWLEELARCGLAEAETRLFVVPRSVAVRAAVGLLVIPGGGASRQVQPRGIACRVIADRLYVPVDAILFPPVTEVEVRALCALPVTFLHPVFGVSGFEAESTLRVWDLLASPEERAEDWNSARVGAPALPGLRFIVLAQPPSLEDLFGGAPDEIATAPPEGLPPAPNEPATDAVTKAGRALRRLFAQGLSAVMQRLPHTNRRRTWANNLEDWANQQLHGIAHELDQLRHKELLRLLHLFDSDPDAALRHALPMNGFAHRGKAPPSGRLGSRSPNFDLTRLGGQAADFWDVPVDVQELLRRRYQDMANREMQLGRYRRAAYIFAELLGDLVSAANALKQGRHFREAALLYEEHLKNPLEAAHCLAAGGLLAEAIERYEALGQWLHAADLYARLGNRSAAETAVRRVVDERIAQDDPVGAAKLLDERLGATEEALQLLWRAWPASGQAAAGVAQAFQILARLGRHEVARERLAQFNREPVPFALAEPLLGALRGPARNYPHEEVRHRAADFSRVLISRQLAGPALPADEAARLMEHLIQLAPHDRLLARDAKRHLAGRREAEVRARWAAPPPLPAHQPVVVRRFELPRQMEWVALRSRWHWFFAIGVTAQRVTLVRGVWEGQLQSASWNSPGEFVKGGLVVEPTGDRGRCVLLKTPGGPAFADKRLPASDACFDAECIAGTPAWMQAMHWPVAPGDETIWTAHVAGGRGILSCHDQRGTLQRTVDVTEDLLAEADRGEETRVCLAVIGERVAIALGDRLVLVHGDGTRQRIELPGQVIGLIPTFAHTRPGLAVMLDHGAAMYWVGAAALMELDRDVASPQGAFIPGGPLVLISGSQLLLLEIDSRGVQQVTRVEHRGERPAHISATASPGHFALLSGRGEMTVYRVPE